MGDGEEIMRKIIMFSAIMFQLILMAHKIGELSDKLDRIENVLNNNQPNTHNTERNNEKN